MTLIMTIMTPITDEELHGAGDGLQPGLDAAGGGADGRHCLCVQAGPQVGREEVNL